jgi:murein L,D-transpeptidase YcbB/YkuD
LRPQPLFDEPTFWRRRFAVLLIVLGAIGANEASRLSASQVSSPEAVRLVQALIAGRDSSLRALYQGSGTPFLWLDQAGQPGRNTHEALRLLRSAAEDGLDPEDYDRSRLDDLMSQLESDSPVSSETLAGFEVTLSAAMVRYLRDLHMGRVDPRAIGFRLRVPADQHDFAALLGAAVALHQIARTAEGLRPKLAQYSALRSALSRYRALAADKTLAPERLQSPAATVHPGDVYDGAAHLHRLLVALGDLPADSLLGNPDRYEGPIVDGVRRFQVRHGLEPDGILGKGTIAAIRVPLAWNVRQIELSLERLRWLPHLTDQRLVAVNIPMFRLWGVRPGAVGPRARGEHGRDRRPGAQHADARVRRRNAGSRLPAVLERAALNPAPRGSPEDRTRCGLSAPAEHRNRDWTRRRCTGSASDLR